ncbi:Coiled-coil domain-containing protein 93-like [Oopsacas minuta]|uniref:Coiled-coil domain-containing protein 93-like n=1 Tax=Oopsacas minuta TaxID=111878 RepID=A0AAV7JUF7_9METZ|nr:Coiled-coil domain-containing protein 93-like [Oopsacas minuta]
MKRGCHSVHQLESRTGCLAQEGEFFILMSIFAHAQIESTKAKIRKSKYDQDGLEIEFDVREDDEQGLKEVQIVDLFVAAGYFRARIKGLSTFDKIVGDLFLSFPISRESIKKADFFTGQLVASLAAVA